MKTLVFGKTGQLATELGRLQGVTCLGRDQADLMAPGLCARRIAESDADAVINAAAYTAVDSAEEDEVAAHVVNTKAPEAMAQAAAEKGIPFVQVSTDYVFDGSGTAPWRPGDATDPLGVYGMTKRAGEKTVSAAGGVHAILRTSWVVSAHGSNFVKTMLRLGAERDHVRVVGDQVGGPTPARDLAVACLAVAQGLIADPVKGGTYHFAGAPDVSWAGFAREIFAQGGLSCRVEEIESADYPTPAERPKNSRFDCTLLETEFGIARPDWRVGLAAILKELKGS